ncbi:MAG TPA: hypothetical protein VKH42_14140 [Vicinamibacterales bacterium]|nr:hypothetical protein [Vicinamibacterales bacterium]
MSLAELQRIVVDTLVGLTATSVVVLAVLAGFCIVVGFTKTKRTAGEGNVIKSLDERMAHRAVDYLPPTAPRGPADQLRAPELLEAAARK